MRAGSRTEGEPSTASHRHAKNDSAPTPSCTWSSSANDLQQSLRLIRLASDHNNTASPKWSSNIKRRKALASLLRLHRNYGFEMPTISRIHFWGFQAKKKLCLWWRWCRYKTFVIVEVDIVLHDSIVMVIKKNSYISFHIWTMTSLRNVLWNEERKCCTSRNIKRHIKFAEEIFYAAISPI